MNLHYLSENAKFYSNQSLPSVKKDNFEMEDTSFHVSFVFYFYAIVGIPPSGNFKKIDYCVKKKPLQTGAPNLNPALLEHGLKRITAQRHQVSNQ